MRDCAQSLAVTSPNRCGAFVACSSDLLVPKLALELEPFQPLKAAFGSCGAHSGLVNSDHA